MVTATERNAASIIGVPDRTAGGSVTAAMTIKCTALGTSLAQVRLSGDSGPEKVSAKARRPDRRTLRSSGPDRDSCFAYTRRLPLGNRSPRSWSKPIRCSCREAIRAWPAPFDSDPSRACARTSDLGACVGTPVRAEPLGAQPMLTRWNTRWRIAARAWLCHVLQRARAPRLVMSLCRRDIPSALPPSWPLSRWS